MNSHLATLSAPRSSRDLCLAVVEIGTPPVEGLGFSKRGGGGRERAFGLHLISISAGKIISQMAILGAEAAPRPHPFYPQKKKKGAARKHGPERLCWHQPAKPNQTHE